MEFCAAGWVDTTHSDQSPFPSPHCRQRSAGFWPLSCTNRARIFWDLLPLLMVKTLDRLGLACAGLFTDSSPRRATKFERERSCCDGTSPRWVAYCMQAVVKAYNISKSPRSAGTGVTTVTKQPGRLTHAGKIKLWRSHERCRCRETDCGRAAGNDTAKVIKTKKRKTRPGANKKKKRGAKLKGCQSRPAIEVRRV